MNPQASLWRPRASIATLRARARMLATTRAFFARLGVLEVDTPIASQAATVDRNIDSLRVDDGSWLQTSPEFAMKRLLAAGIGPCYQIAHVFRRENCGRLHQPEFTLLEWYRPGWTHLQLMEEVEALVRALGAGARRFERRSYRQVFGEFVGADPFTATPADLRRILRQRDQELPRTSTVAELDFWLDACMGLLVLPRLGVEAPCFIFDYPASQAALARVRNDDPPVAERFELVWRGLELANGFNELLDAEEQARRFAADLDWRARHGRDRPPADERLLAALAAGLPACAGVALGLDRLLMLLLSLPEIADVMAFDRERA
ncbi:MAG: EF-P lysine aminoacylase GenX [Gammaproteobacteria bacterium]|nr:EF-P lysine aminoacylase GenX [Gammaproteobacteria bacterium]